MSDAREKLGAFRYWVGSPASREAAGKLPEGTEWVDDERVPYGCVYGTDHDPRDAMLVPPEIAEWAAQAAQAADQAAPAVDIEPWDGPFRIHGFPAEEDEHGTE